MIKRLLPNACRVRIVPLFAPVAAQPRNWVASERFFGIRQVQGLLGVETK
jgi:hypothetical protein